MRLSTAAPLRWLGGSTRMSLRLTRQSHHGSIPGLVHSCPTLGPSPHPASGLAPCGWLGIQSSTFPRWNWTLSIKLRVASRSRWPHLPSGGLHLLYVGHGRLGPWLGKHILGSLKPLSLPFIDSPELGIQVGTSPSGRSGRRDISQQLWQRGVIRIRWVPNGPGS